MWINYTEEITDSVDELTTREKKREADRAVSDRLKMLRLLKSGTCRSLARAASVLGYSERQLQRWWKSYREEGLEALLEVKKPGGQDEKVTPEAWEALEAKMKQGRIARLKDAQQFLREEFDIHYKSESGISRLFKRRGVKLKTGRPRHKDADPEAQEAFKK